MFSALCVVFLLGAPLKGPAIQALWAHRPHDPPVPNHVAAAQDGAPEQLSVASDVDFHAIDHIFDLHKKSERSSEAPENVSTPAPEPPEAAAAPAPEPAPEAAATPAPPEATPAEAPTPVPCVPHRLPDYSWSWCPAAGAVPAPAPEASKPESPETFVAAPDADAASAPCVPHRLANYSWSWCPEAGAVPAPEAPVPEVGSEAPAPDEPEDPEDTEKDPKLSPEDPEAVAAPAPESPESVLQPAPDADPLAAGITAVAAPAPMDPNDPELVTAPGADPDDQPAPERPNDDPVWVIAAPPSDDGPQAIVTTPAQDEVPATFIAAPDAVASPAPEPSETAPDAVASPSPAAESVPEANVPETEVPEAEQVPETEVPEAEVPEAEQVPETEVPDAEVPDAEDVPEAEVPFSLVAAPTVKAKPGAKEAPAPVAKAVPGGLPGRAQVLVVVSDHASGTTEFGKALAKHPCVFDLGEPFAFSDTVWSTSEVAQCDSYTFPIGIFDADTRALKSNVNPQLKEKILKMGTSVSKPILVDQRVTPLTGDASPLYNGLHYNLADYFVRIRDLVCKGVPADVCLPSQCTITLNMFPAYVNANTAGKLMEEDVQSPCTIARNEKAMAAWNEALETMQTHPKVAMVEIARREVDRQFSAFKRFSPPSSKFDCSLPRPPSTFATASKLYVDGKIEIEDCWTGAEAADKCLGDALQLVGLTIEPMGDMGARVMAGPNATTLLEPMNSGAADHGFGTEEQACSTDPTAIYEVLANDVNHKPTSNDPNAIVKRVLKVGVGTGAGQAAVKPEPVAKATPAPSAKPTPAPAAKPTLEPVMDSTPSPATSEPIAATTPAPAEKPAPVAATTPVPGVKPAPAIATAPAPVATATPVGAAGRAQVLVIVSDHGSGTTEVGEALNIHPCVFDLGEPFSAASRVWSTSKVSECENIGKPVPQSIFDADTGTLKNSSNPVLTSKILGLSNQGTVHGTKSPSQAPVGLSGDDPSLYAGLHYDIADYFVRIRDLVCKGVPADVCPPSDCTITLKMFPQFVNANTAGQLVKEKPPGKCTLALNAKEMLAWKSQLDAIVKHPKVAMMAIARKEIDRQFSAFHRFAPAGTEFDCSLQRGPSEFAVLATSVADGKIEIEDCWTGAEAADKCLGDALQLVGLTTGPMGALGSAKMSISNLESDAAHKKTAFDCSTDPRAIFKRLEDDNVEKVAEADEGGEPEKRNTFLQWLM